MRQFCIDNPDYFKELQSKISGTFVNMTAEEINDIQKDMKAIDNQVDKKTKEIAKDKKTKKE